MTQKSLSILALSLTLSTSALSAHAASNAVSGANPRPQAVSGANPRPQSGSSGASSQDPSIWTILLTALGL